MRIKSKEYLENNISYLHSSLNIAVIYGGEADKNGAVINKTHNPRATKTYEYVADDILQALVACGFKNVIKLPEDMNLSSALLENDIHICWLNSGGTQGYCSVSHAPSTLELLGIPYIGHNPLNAAVLDNKHIFKSMLASMDIKTAEFLVCNPNSAGGDDFINAQLDAHFKNHHGAFIVKPVSGRASQHVHHVPHRSELLDVIKHVNDITGGNVMIESFLGGDEYTMAVMGPILSKKNTIIDKAVPFAFSGVQRILSPDEMIFTSMDVKNISNDRMRVLSQDTDEHVINQLKEISSRIYQELDLETAVRIDFRADDSGVIHVLEANPKPDLKRPVKNQISLICAGLDDENMSYECLIQSMFINRVHDLITYKRKMAPKLCSLLPAH